MRMRPKLAAGSAAAVLTPTASAAGSPSGQLRFRCRRRAPTDTRSAELSALAQVKRDVAGAAVDRGMSTRAAAAGPRPGAVAAVVRLGSPPVTRCR